MRGSVLKPFIERIADCQRTNSVPAFRKLTLFSIDVIPLYELGLYISASSCFYFFPPTCLWTFMEQWPSLLKITEDSVNYPLFILLSYRYNISWWRIFILNSSVTDKNTCYDLSFIEYNVSFPTRNVYPYSITKQSQFLNVRQMIQIEVLGLKIKQTRTE